VQVNGKVISSAYVLKSNDQITHRNHRHEPPVSAGKISILADSKDFIAVNKPSSIPVHPSGRYRHNCLLHILRKEIHPNGQLGDPLYALHRLDRLTSGVIILCKDRSKISRVMKQFKSQMIGKEYICIVDGEFPRYVISPTDLH
jgi:23S rRNA-/tRNA-specific pseudouridylate synthase